MLLSLILIITHLLLSNLKLYIFDYATISSDVRHYHPRSIQGVTEVSCVLTNPTPLYLLKGSVIWMRLALVRFVEIW